MKRKFREAFILVISLVLFLSGFNPAGAYYNPSSGRFNRMDPYTGEKTQPQSLNKYTYCHNNPVGMIDPSGEFSITRVAVAVSIGSILIALSAHFYLQEQYRDLPRVVDVRISVNPDGKPSTWNTVNITSQLRQTLVPFTSNLISGQGISLQMVDEAAQPSMLEWTVESGLKIRYDGRVEFTGQSLPYGGLAFSGNGNTIISTTNVNNHVAGVPDRVNYNILWSNILAHEQIWLNAAGQFDSKLSIQGDISHPVASHNVSATISQRSTDVLLKAFQFNAK